MKNNFKIFKSAAAILLVVVLLLSLVACGAGVSSASDANGSHGSLTWEYKKDGQTLTISGSGSMNNFGDTGSVAWAKVRASVKNLVINDGITSIGDYAFSSMTQLESVKLPASLKSIGKLSFAFCTSLKTITIPVNVDTIGHGAFEASGLTTIELTSVKEIAPRAFAYCDELTSFIGNSAEKIGDEAFLYCKNLESVKLPEAFNRETAVGKDAFKNAKITQSDIKVADGKFIVTVKHVFEDEKEAKAPYTADIKKGDPFEYTAPTIEGYTANPTRISETINKDETYTIVYKKIVESVETETEAPAPKEDEDLDPMTIVAIVAMVLVIIGLVVGAIIFIRKDKKNSNATVRKNKDSKSDKNAKKRK